MRINEYFFNMTSYIQVGKMNITYLGDLALESGGSKIAPVPKFTCLLLWEIKKTSIPQLLHWGAELIDL